MRITPRAKPVARFGEIIIPLLLQYLQESLLDKTIQHGRDAKMTNASIWFWDGYAPDWPGNVIPCFQLSADLRPFPFQVPGQFRDLHTIYTGAASVSYDFPQGRLYVVTFQYQFH